MNQTHFIERPPRLQPEMPAGEVQIPDPPQDESRQGAPLLQLIALPMVSVLGIVLVSVFGSGRSLLMIFPMLLSLLVTSAVALHTIDKTRKLKAEREAAYFRSLLELRKEMTTAHAIQLRSALHNAPGPAEAFRVAAEAGAVAGSGRPAGRFGARLWERRAGDEDFGAVRLGLGAVPSRVVYKFDATKFTGDPLTRDAARLASDSLIIQDAPVTLYMRHGPQSDSVAQVKDESPDDKIQKPVIIPRHAVGVFGPKPELTYSFMWAVLAHYAAFHAPSDARLYILGLQETQNNWRWTGRLPHCSGDGPAQTLCFETPKDRSAGKEQNRLAIFLRGLRKTLEDRRMRLADSDSAAGVDLPHLLIVVDLLTPPPDGSALNDLEIDPGISLLIHDGQRLGASVFFLTPSAGRVPSGCQAVIELTIDANLLEGATTGNLIGFRYAEVGAEPARKAGLADLVSDPQALVDFAGQLQPLHVRQTYGADLPRSLDLLDMLSAHSMEELQSAMLANWQRSKQSDLAAWLNASVGVMSGGDIRRMTFSSDADGVHGLIAGSTGSGKSELLSTLILSLAYNFDPTILNFVLVDFKGGAAFDPFRNLPHVVDLVTNLGGNAVERMFAAIMAEIHRREAINVAYGAKHIVHYRKMGLHQYPYGQEVVIKGEKHYTAPYPHLFVFIDEFAEMIAESPEYKAQLNSITRLGRALGVHLILAAQRPTGVTDQMRANIKFRIALRVETREESGEILRRPDAAFLPTGIPGRGYLQIGNENVEMIQVAWSGADFLGDRPEAQPAVVWHDRPPRKRRVAQSTDEAPKVFEVLVNLMADMSRQHSVPQRKPWPDFLPADLALETPIDAASLSAEGLNLIIERRPPAAGNEKTPAALPLDTAVSEWFNGKGSWRGASWRDTAMRPLLGLVDNPEHAEQFPLLADFRRGHAAIFGGSGWGKTTFLRALLASLAARLSPSELHVYILDFGGRQMGIFRDLPHVGAVINADEDERVVRLLRMIDALLESRKTALSDAGADDLYAYNLAHPDRVLPAVLVMIDNFAEFKEAFEGLLPMLTSILRESRAYGIHFTITADAPSVLSGKLMGMFTERFALKLTDPSDYLEIVGRGARAIDDIPGRGYVHVGRQALSFQAAMPVGENTGAGEDAQKLGQLVRWMKDAAPQPADGLATEHRAAPVNTLANRVQLAALLPAQIEPQPVLRPILGIDDRTLAPWRFEALRDGPHMLILAPPGGGKTSTLRSLALSLTYLYPPEQVALVLIDYQGRFVNYSGNRTLADLPHVLAVVSKPSDLDSFVELLKAETAQMIGKKRSIFVLIDNYDTFTEESRISRTALPMLGSLAREFGTFGLHFALAGSQDAARAMDELRKQVTNARFGLALASAELVNNLNGRPPRGIGAEELPLGRGFVVRGGKTFMVQLATPYGSSQAGVEEQPEVSLDAWVLHIQERYPDRAPLLRQLGGDGAVGQAPAASQAVAGAAPQPVASAAGNGGNGSTAVQPTLAASAAQKPPAGSKIPDGVTLDQIKVKLLESGLAPALLALLSPADMMGMAAEMKLFEPAKQT